MSGGSPFLNSRHRTRVPPLLRGDRLVSLLTPYPKTLPHPGSTGRETLCSSSSHTGLSTSKTTSHGIPGLVDLTVPLDPRPPNPDRIVQPGQQTRSTTSLWCLNPYPLDSPGLLVDDPTFVVYREKGDSPERPHPLPNRVVGLLKRILL